MKGDDTEKKEWEKSNVPEIQPLFPLRTEGGCQHRETDKRKKKVLAIRSILSRRGADF